MIKDSSEVKVGATALAGIVVFLVIISFLGAFNFASRGYTVNVMYDQVNGLKAGGEVRFAGVNIGKVKDITVEGSKVKVILGINKDVKIPDDSTFSVGADGVMGAKFVTIDPKENPSVNYVKDEQIVDGVRAQGLDEFMASSAKVLAKVEGIADAFNNVFGDKNVQRSMREGFLNARDISNNLNTFTKVMADTAIANQSEINNMVQQMGSMAQRMNNVAEHLNSIVAGADDNGATGRNVAVMAKNLAAASARIESMSKNLEEVVGDPKTKEDLKATIKNAKETSDKANRILGVVSGAKPRVDLLYKGNDHGEDKRWRVDAGVEFPVSDSTSFYLGGARIGDDTKLDFSLAKKWNNKMGLRGGIMEGSFGVGVDYTFGNKFRLFSDLYDFNEAKVRVGGEYKLTDEISLLGEVMNVRSDGSDTAYFGLRSQF